MSCCHNCKARTENCKTYCTQRAAEVLMNDLIKISIRKQKQTRVAVDDIIIRRWETSRRKKSRQA